MSKLEACSGLRAFYDTREDGAAWNVAECRPSAIFKRLVFEDLRREVSSHCMAADWIMEA